LERIQRDFERDYFMDPRGALEYGIIDHIIGEAPPSEGDHDEEDGDKDR